MFDEDLGVHGHPDSLIQPTNQTNAGTLETTSTIVVDQFPSGNAGAPIPGMACGSSVYESCEAMHTDSIWAPFKSQRDWRFAHWAKMHGPTSSAVTELLEIPEVRTSP